MADEAKPGKVGRPSILTEEISNGLIRLVAAGNYLTTACRALRVPYRTAQRWLERGRKEQGGPYFDFAVSILQAEAYAEITNLQTVLMAAKTDPHWAAWYLANKHPEKWSAQRQLIKDLEARLRELEKASANK